MIFGIENGFLKEEMFDKYLWKRLKLLISSLDDYLMNIKFPGNIYYLIKSLNKKRNIIFGAGVRGCFLYHYINNELELDAFCDNNENLWYGEYDGIKIFPLSECIKKYSDAFYIITVKKL